MSFLDEEITVNVRKGDPIPDDLPDGSTVNVAEKKGRDLDGDGDVDSDDYLAARNAAIKKAKSMKESVAKDLYIKAMESSSLEEFLSDVYQDYPQHKGNSDIADYLKNYYLDAGGPLNEGSLKSLLVALGIGAASVGLLKKLDASDPVVKAIKTAQEKGLVDTPAEKKAAKDMLLRRGVWLDTGKGEGGDITVANVNKALKEVSITSDYFRKTMNEDLRGLMAQGEKMAAFANKQSGYEGGVSSPVRGVLAAMAAAGAPDFNGDKDLKAYWTRQLTKAIKTQMGRKYMSGLNEKAKTIELPADTTFTVDLKHLMKKHMDEGKSKEDTIKFTKALMAKLHNKGEVTVDGTKIVFKEGKKKSGYMGYTDMANEASIMGIPLESFADYYTALDLAKNIGVPVVAFSALLAIMGVQRATEFLKKGKEAVMDWYKQNVNEQEDAQLALPEPDAPDYLGDDGMDYEGGMAKSQMLKMKKYAVALCDMIDDESQLESWVQAKLTKASDYMSSVYHYLDYQQSKMNEGRLQFALNGQEVIPNGTPDGELNAYYKNSEKDLTPDEIDTLINTYDSDFEVGGAYWETLR